MPANAIQSPAMRKILLLPLLLLLTACTPDAPDAMTETPAVTDTKLDTFLLGGIQVNEPDHDAWVHSLDAHGLNTVAVTVYAHQGNWDTDHLWFDEDNQWVLHEIRTAKQAGLEVVLILRLALDHAYDANRFLWHGMVMPGTDEQVRNWFRRYARFVGEWAAIAQTEGVDLLGVGSELNALASTLPVDEIPPLVAYYQDDEQQEIHLRDVLAQRGPEAAAQERAEIDKKRAWASTMTGGGAPDRLARINARRQLLQECWVWLIDGVREHYAGPLTYAANFDQYHEIGFWQHLDVIGINAYFPLREHFLDQELGPQAHQLEGEARAEVLRPRLEAGWRKVFDDIDTFRGEQNIEELPIVFTELGYTPRRDGTLAPWAGDGMTVVWTPPLEMNEAGEPLGEGEKRALVWAEQPVDRLERALAVEALHNVHEARAAAAKGQEVTRGPLRGILYWKLSTQPSHRDIEPFVLILGDSPPDPLLTALQSFRQGD